MSRPNITDATATALGFARACVLDQRVASHDRNDHSWDEKYTQALDALEGIIKAHRKSTDARKPTP